MATARQALPRKLIRLIISHSSKVSFILVILVGTDGAHASPLNRGMGVARGESRSEADTVICTEWNQRKEAARDKRL